MKEEKIIKELQRIINLYLQKKITKKEMIDYAEKIKIKYNGS